MSEKKIVWLLLMGCLIVCIGTLSFGNMVDAIYYGAWAIALLIVQLKGNGKTEGNKHR